MVFLYDLTMPEILRRILAALLHAGLQGGLLAAFLWLGGDRVAKDEGRLTLNPFRHLALSGVFLCVAFRISWIQALPLGPTIGPVPAAARLRPLLAVLASLAVLLALVPLLDLARAPLHQLLPRSAGYMVLASMDTLQHVLTGSVLLALLPLPGMLVGNALPALWPGLGKRWRRWQGLGMASAAILVILGWFPNVAALVAALRLI